MDMKIIIFGAGKMTIRFLEENDNILYDILAIADNDESRQGTELVHGDRSFKIISAEEILKYEFDLVLITIANLGFQLEIMTQLTGMGIPYDKVKFLRNRKIENGIRVLDDYNAENDENVILFDVTKIAQNDNGTGIQRTVNELYRNMSSMGAEICPVQLVSGRWITARSFECRMKKIKYDDIEYSVNVTGRKIFLPDASWDNNGLLESMAGDTSVCFIVYDLIPILQPMCVFDKHQKQFTEWINKVIKSASKCVCISRTVADDLMAYYEKIKPERTHPLEIHYMHLGFDMPKVGGTVRKEIANFVNCGTTFLIVGTVEIRKNHYLLLKSLKRVCQAYSDKKIQLLILGRDGWKNDKFKEMYANDELIKERVLWIKDAGDYEVQWAYQNCSALVYPTMAEGFGLPLVEAAHFRLPIMCSDMPIFHEIVGDNVDYFKLNDEESLTKTMLRWIKSSQHPESGNIRTYTWKECAVEVVDILDNKVKPYAVMQ